MSNLNNSNEQEEQYKQDKQEITIYNEDGTYKKWSDVYSAIFPKVTTCNISWNEFWDMEPVDVIEVVLAYRKELIDKTNYDLALAWYNASLCGIAQNNAKMFPKKPSRVPNEQDEIAKNKKLITFFNNISKEGVD